MSAQVLIACIAPVGEHLAPKMNTVYSKSSNSSAQSKRRIYFSVFGVNWNLNVHHLSDCSDGCFLSRNRVTTSKLQSSSDSVRSISFGQPTFKLDFALESLWSFFLAFLGWLRHVLVKSILQIHFVLFKFLNVVLAEILVNCILVEGELFRILIKLYLHPLVLGNCDFEDNWKIRLWFPQNSNLRLLSHCNSPDKQVLF